MDKKPTLKSWMATAIVLRRNNIPPELRNLISSFLCGEEKWHVAFGCVIDEYVSMIDAFAFITSFNGFMTGGACNWI